MSHPVLRIAKRIKKLPFEERHGYNITEIIVEEYGTFEEDAMFMFAKHLEDLANGWFNS